MKKTIILNQSKSVLSRGKKIDNEIENFKQIIINNIPSIYDLNTLDINIIKYIRQTYIYNNTQKNNLINQIKKKL